MSREREVPEPSLLPDNTFVSVLMLLVILITTSTFGIVLGYAVLSAIR